MKYKEVLSLCTLIFDHMTEGCANTDLLIQTLSTSLILIAKELFADTVSVQPTGKNHVLATRIKSYLDTHYAEDITLVKIADELRISPYYAAHVFKDVMGYSPIQYMIRRRIGEAQTLLINSEYNATQIATMVGYDNTNYFCTLFSKMVGLSPIRYRASYREKMCGQTTQ
ncbi:MAG: helix-turn-helix transcriptional regulator [Intestinibacillus sp.]